MCTVDDFFNHTALLSISYSTCQKGMFHTTMSACPKWAICGERLSVHERYWLKRISEAFLKSPVDGAKCMPMQMFPNSSFSSSKLTAPATHLSQNLQLHSLYLKRQILQAGRRGFTNHVSSVCCG
jgi:hypothetical protein